MMVVIMAALATLAGSQAASATDNDRNVIRRMAALDDCARYAAVVATVDSLAKDHDALLRVSDMAEALLYDPSSPDADEALYRLWVVSLIERGGLTDVEKVRPMAQIEEMAKNAAGTKAADAEVELPDGSAASLLSLLGKEGDTLVLFYDPDCDHCEEVISSLREGGMTESASRILAVCVEGDRDTWIDKIQEMPADWTHAYATPTLGADADEEIYVLRMMPTAYLISPEGIVVKKNLRL